MLRVGIIGGSGYTGAELMRLLVVHPEAELIAVTSRAYSGRSVCDLFPNLRGHLTLEFSDPDAARLDRCNVVFSATPNGIAMQHAPRLLDAGVTLIDLAADFRIKDPELWERWYGMPHCCPELLSQAVYGLPEVHRTRLHGAQLVANPGCYPTAVQLGFLPLLEAELIDPRSLIADAKSGVSGAGRKESLTTQLAEAGESFRAYAASGHRHLPEILQGLRHFDGDAELTFVPHLVPMIRGIHATLYATLRETDADADVRIQEAFEQRFRDEPFVDVMAFASHPDTRAVRGANICRIACHRPQGGKQIVVLVVEDNLVKGAAGQAIQNMNIAFGLDETLGLVAPAWLP
ncbi:MAG: N-acetyl-gamma-glutamyl-phosphate reductase [Gammaproteobacteria bacterium]|nr:N-acetyl-gamma-glutamyl-phosphate reductase [Gammaproteobacteria bacterium]